MSAMEKRPPDDKPPREPLFFVECSSGQKAQSHRVLPRDRTDDLWARLKKRSTLAYDSDHADEQWELATKQEEWRVLREELWFQMREVLKECLIMTEDQLSDSFSPECQEELFIKIILESRKRN